jgi:hypothetical protein
VAMVLLHSLLFHSPCSAKKPPYIFVKHSFIALLHY